MSQFGVPNYVFACFLWCESECAHIVRQAYVPTLCVNLYVHAFAPVRSPQSWICRDHCSHCRVTIVLVWEVCMSVTTGGFGRICWRGPQSQCLSVGRRALRPALRKAAWSLPPSGGVTRLRPCNLQSAWGGATTSVYAARPVNGVCARLGPKYMRPGQGRCLAEEGAAASVTTATTSYI